MPVKVLAGGGLSTFRQEYHLPQRWLPVVLPGERIGLDGVGELPGEMDAQPAVDGEHAGVERHVVRGAGGQAVARIEPLDR